MKTFYGALFFVCPLIMLGCGQDDDGARRDASVLLDGGTTMLDAAVIDRKDSGVDVAVADASTADATVSSDLAVAEADALGDVAGDAAPPSCTVGTAQSGATSGTLDLFGAVAYFDDGASQPAGTYEVVYLDGCMKYASVQKWAVHAYAPPNQGWYLVGDSSATRLAHLPGAVGFEVYAEFDACVAASKLVAPVQFEHKGGKIGVWLFDSHYSDNVAGLEGRNPKWRLNKLGSACPL